MEHGWHTSHQDFHRDRADLIPCIGTERQTNDFLNQWERTHGTTAKIKTVQYTSTGRIVRLG